MNVDHERAREIAMTVVGQTPCSDDSCIVANGYLDLRGRLLAYFDAQDALEAKREHDAPLSDVAARQARTALAALRTALRP